MDFLNNIINTGNGILWGYVLIYGLIGVGLYFTVKSGFVQFRLFGDMVRLLTEKATEKRDENSKSVTSFQAFCISLASRVGTGNLAGVAIAIAVGGPGAVFWMWVIALIGAASGFVESTLGQIYKVKDGDGFRGGPAYYIEQGLKNKNLGIFFSILITISYALVLNSVQANTISLAFEEAFGISRLAVGIVVALLTAIIIFGGVHRIARVSETLVPFMATIYIIMALFVVFKNITMIPSIFSLIFSSAFGLKAAVGGGMGAALMNGIKRGLFSNEAGIGSVPNAAATADVTHPVKQGLIQTLGVFTDTLVICTATAFMILISGAYTTPGLTGIQLTQVAFSSQIGDWANVFVAVSIFLFAFSSIIGNYYYGETNISFLKSDKNTLLIFRITVIGMVIFGSVAKVAIVWNMADLFIGLMAVTNLIGILLLSRYAFEALDDYVKQKKQGINPVFKASTIKGLEVVECWGNEAKSEVS
jgi:AGCS family alanine or glycine:cation symporter